jgi:NAD(P)H-flavin reductase
MEQELSVGKSVWLKLPFGDLFTQEHSKKMSFLLPAEQG